MGEQHRRRTRQLKIFLYDEELQILEDQCEKFTMSKSAFLRNCILYGGVILP